MKFYKKCRSKLDKRFSIAIDTETTGLSSYHGARPFMLQAAWRVDDDAIAHAVVQFPVNPVTREVDYTKPSSSKQYDLILDFLYDDSVSKVFHNAKFDLKMLAAMPVEVRGPIEDTLLAARTCFTLEESYGLKKLAKKYLEIDDVDESALKKSVIKARNLAKKKYPEYKLGDNLEEDYWLPHHLDSNNDFCEIYGVLDVKRTIQLWEFYQQGLTELNCWRAYNLEMELMPVLIQMENRGIRLDYNKNLQQISYCWREQAKCKKEFIRTSKCDSEININSWQQLVPVLKNAGVNVESTAKEVLDAFIPTDPELKNTPLGWDYECLYWLLSYKGYEKGVGYFKDYVTRSYQDSNRSVDDMLDWNNCYAISPWFNQANTVTWRLSCNSPNLQNVSNPETSGGFNVVNARVVFGPRPGYTWYHFDYSGLEMRIFASRANEPYMLEAFRNGRDIHDECRKRVPELLALPPKVGRKLAKNVGFCKIFGGGAGALVKYVNQPEDYCRGIIKAYDKEFPTIVSYIRRIASSGRTSGYIKNAFGRNINVDPEYSYRACNYDVQSSAADLMKRGMIKVNHFLKNDPRKLDAHIVLSIHDEIVVEIKKEHAFKSVILKIKELMEDHEGAFCIDMPVEVEKTSTYWSEKSSWGLEWLNGITCSKCNKKKEIKNISDAGKLGYVEVNKKWYCRGCVNAMAGK